MTDTCGCCVSAVPPRPGDLSNRSGLSAIAYRLGTFGSFRHALLSQIAGTPELASLRTRASDDYSVAAIELWAAIADVLTFYQERTANEGFLRTAVLRDSVLRMVRLLGYELRPGLAATTWLAFTAERGKTARIPATTRVKSVPLYDEPAQTFEILDVLAADAAWNRLTPVRMRPRTVAAGAQDTVFDGLTTGLTPGDMLVFVQGDVTAHPAGTRWDVTRVQQVVADSATRTTHVTWTPALGSSGRPVPIGPTVYALRQRAAIFGASAADWRLIADAGKAALLGLSSPDDLTAADKLEWPSFDIYAPADSQPRIPTSSGTVTILPTAQDVADAALAAVKATNQAVVADAITSAVKVVTLAGQTTAAASQTLSSLAWTSAESARRVFDAFGASATDAVDALQPLRDQASDLAAASSTLGGLLTGFDFADPPDLHDIVDAGNTLVQRADLFQASLLDAAAKVLAFPATALSNVRSEFQQPPAAGSIADLLQQLAAQVQNLVGLAGDTAGAAVDAVNAGARTMGSMLADEAVRIAVKTVMDGRDPFPEPTPERVAAAAILAARIVERVMARDAVIVAAAAGGGAAMVAAAAPVAVAGIAGGVALLTAAAVIAPLMVPVVAGAAAAAFLLQPAAQDGARRIADEVTAAVTRALNPQVRPAPARFAALTPRTDSIDLDTVYPRIVNDGWLVLSEPGLTELYRVVDVQQTSRTDFALTGKVTRVQLAGNNLAPDPVTHHSHYGVRETTVFAVSEPLKLAPKIDTRPVSGAQILVEATSPPPPPGRRLLVAGTDTAGVASCELVTVVAATADPAGTLLDVTPGLAHQYRRDDLAIHGNVAYATHGETVRAEIVGDADATVPFQRFRLDKKPVTYVPSATGRDGAESTLKLFVNDVRWREEPTFYGTGERDEVFVARIADDATLTVQTGDGLTGARPPSGRGNVVATYRTGLGLAGRIRAAGLTTLLDRPTGVRGVTNPCAADGGADPETMDHARESAPGTVRTFGRLVSLRDAEDIAMASGEVAKAAARWVWTGERRAIHVTVAAQGGATFSADGLRRIQETMNTHRDPNHTLVVANYVRVPIVVAASLTAAPERANVKVLDAARAALLDALSFERVDFAQFINMSDLIAVLQAVPGVIAVDLDDLNFKDPTVRAAHGADATRPQPHLRLLPARPPGPAGGAVLAAEQACVEMPEQDVVLVASGGVLA